MTRVPATLPFEEIVERVRAIDPEMIMGYPSVLAQLATEQAAGRLGLRLRALTTSSETLTTAVRAQLETAFGVGVVDLFGSSEGLIGVSEPGDTVVSFASDGCIVEPVDEHDQPVPVGEPSAAVLITNLYNLVQPLIRYRVDDRFVQAPPSPRHGHFRAEIDGRTSESLRWGEVVVHPLAVTNELLQTPAIVDYVVRQTSAGVAIEVVAVAPVDLASVAAAIQRDLGAAGLVDAEVVITCIDEVPRHAQTGKAKRIVPLGG